MLKSRGFRPVHQHPADWEFSANFDVLGRKLTVNTTVPAFGAEFERLLRSFPAWSGNSSETGPELSFLIDLQPAAKEQNKRPLYQIQCGDVTIGKSADLWQLFGRLEHQLDVFLTRTISEQLLLRGSAVARDGRGMLWLGEPGSGKSSMALALLEHGFEYYTDNLVIINPATACLTPFPKPLSLSAPTLFPQLPQKLWFGPPTCHSRRKKVMGCTETPRWYLHPNAVRPNSVGMRPVPIKSIFFPTYVARAKPEFEPLTSGQALRRLCDTVLNENVFVGDALALATKLVRNARCFSVVVNGPEATLEAIDQLL